MSVPACPSPDKSIEWEYLWASYDASTYKLVLDQLNSNEIIMDIGAGDLRLARKMATLTRKVYALEINRSILDEGLRLFRSFAGESDPDLYRRPGIRLPHRHHERSPVNAALHSLSVVCGKIT